jgi:hypothetical protein
MDTEKAERRKRRIFLLTDEHGETQIFYKMDTEKAERRKRRIFFAHG